MKEFKVGDYWRSRDGNKWRILAIDRRGECPIVAMHMTSGNINTLLPSGLYGTGEMVSDLLEPWEDTEPKLIAWLICPKAAVPPTSWDIRFFPEDSTDNRVVTLFNCRRAPWLDPPEGK